MNCGAAFATSAKAAAAACKAAAGAWLITAIGTAPVSAAQTRLQLTGGLTVSDFDFREFDSRGDTLVTEQGDIAGLLLHGRMISEPYFAGIKLRYSRGKVDYRAYPGNARLVSDTKQSILNYSLFAGRQWQLAERLSLDAALGIGERRWRRNILSTATAGGLDEDYHWPYMHLDFGTHYAIDTSNTLGLGLSWYEVRSADLKVRFKNRQFDTTTLDLPHGDGLQISLAWRHRWSESVTFVLAPSYRQWRIPRSNAFALFRGGLPTNSSVIEPESETDIVAIAFSITRQW